MTTAILYTINKRTRAYEREELPEKRIRKMHKVERVYDFMLTGNDYHHPAALTDIQDGLAVYRIIDKV